MAFPTSISSYHFSRVAISTDATAIAAAIATPTEANFKSAFDAPADYVEIKNIRDMPQFGDPANIVSVPVYGQQSAVNIGAQSDAQTLELVINYVMSDWSAGSVLGGYVGDGIPKVFQMALLTTDVTDLATNTTTGGLRTKPNGLIYFIGKIESLQGTPARDDAATATVAISRQSRFFGPYTVTGV